MNISIKNFNVLVKEEYLYDGSSDKVGKYRKGQVIGVSTYINCPLSFHVLIDGSYLYSDLPITSIVHKESHSDFSLKTLSHTNCPSYEIDNFTFNVFIDKEVAVFLKDINTWSFGKYITSFDFYTDNLSLHLIKLNNGLFALVPNHKINWDGNMQLTDFKKNHINRCN